MQSRSLLTVKSIVSNRVNCRTPTNSSSCLRLLAVVSLLIIVSPSLNTVRAQEDAPKSAEELKLEEEARVWKLKQEIAASKREAAASAFPESEVKALEGNMTLDDNVQIEANIMAMRAMTNIAKQISDQIKTGNKDLKKIIIYNQQDANSLLAYKVFMTQLTLLVLQYQQEIEGKLEMPSGVFDRGMQGLSTPLTPGLALGMGTSTVKSVIDLVSLFRTDTDIKGKEITIDESALVAELANELKSNSQIQVYHPLLYPIDVNPEEPSELLLLPMTLNYLKSKAEAKIAEHQDKISIKDQAKDKSAIDELQRKIAHLQALNGGVDKIIDNLMKVDETTGLNALTSLVRASNLNGLLEEGDGYILYLKIQKAGGNNKTTKNLFTGSKLYHSGGSIISYMLFDADGSIKLSKTIPYYLKYMKSGDLAKDTDGKK
jgi:hypothetical protein